MSRSVYINSIGAFLPGEPVLSSQMEEYIGVINGKPSRNRAVVLRQNRIKTRHYAIDKKGRQLFSSAEMASLAIKDAIAKSEILASDITYLATASTLGDMLVPGLASHVHADIFGSRFLTFHIIRWCGSHGVGKQTQ